MSKPQCPKCGESAGFYDLSLHKHQQSYTFAGEADNCEVTFSRGGKRKFCNECDADITAYVESLGLDV